MRVVVISAVGKNFTAGLDLSDMSGGEPDKDVGRRAMATREHVLEIQDLDGRLEAAATSLKGFTTLLHDDTAMLNMVRTTRTRTRTLI